MPRKRTFDEMVDSDPPQAPQDPTLSSKLRNMWEFSCVHQFLDLFGQVLRIPKIDIEDFETECLNTGSSLVIEEIGLQILKWVSSHRGINLENWDEWARRQYQQKTPTRPNPYGEDDEPKHFRDFHIFDKLRILHQLSVWTFWNPDRIRQAMSDVKDTDQFYDWQSHPIGWDREDRIYYGISNRLYRRTEPPIPEPTKSKSKSKSTPKSKYTSKKAAAQRRKERTSKRRRVDVSDQDVDMNDIDNTVDETQIDAEETELPVDVDPTQVNTFGDYKWECMAVSLDDFKQFIATIAKSKDPNERNLKEKIEDDMIPELAAMEERRQRKVEARLKEIQMVEKMQGAKRSGRLAAKHEKEREEAETAATERQRRSLLQAARQEEEKQQQLDDDRRSRMLTREQRIKEREYKRILMEDQLARDAEEQERVEQDGARGSRQLKERIEKNKKELEELEEEEDWTFDCSGCGRYGKNWDDGQHSIACERCNVWQHSKCLGFTKSAAESDDFHFVCDDCLRKEEEANRPKISLKLKLGHSSSPPQQRLAPKDEDATRAKLVSVDVPQPRHIQPPASGAPVNGQSHPPPDTMNTSFPPPQRAQSSQQSVPGGNVRQLQQAPHMNGGQQGPPDAPNSFLPRVGVANATNVQHQPFLPRQPSNLQQNQQVRSTSSHAYTPRATSSQVNGGSSPIRQRIPSPMINRPTMSPTQGNPEVGRIVGLPGSSPTLPPATLATPHTNGNRASSYSNGVFVQATPVQQSLSRNGSFSASQSAQPMSGLSPTKQRISATPIPTPTLVPRKGGSFTTPSSSFNNAHNIRSVSGTPIFPPVENLAPSPHQLNRDPVPTPSKQSVPSPPPLVENSSGPPQPPSFDSAVAQATADRNMAMTEQNERQRYQHQQQGTVQ